MHTFFFPLVYIGIKHRILATFNINKKFNSDSLYCMPLSVNNHFHP